MKCEARSCGTPETNMAQESGTQMFHEENENSKYNFMLFA